MGTKEIKEADVKSYARKMFKDKGYYYFPVNQGMFSRAGIPDDCLCRQAGSWRWSSRASSAGATRQHCRDLLRCWR